MKIVDFGLGQEKITPPTTSPTSPWSVAIVTSVLGAVTGWVLDGATRNARRKRKR